MLEAQGAQSAGGKYDITLQLKSEVSQLSGQNSELRSRLHHCEGELRDAVRLLERKECEVMCYTYIHVHMCGSLSTRSRETLLTPSYKNLHVHVNSSTSFA